MADKVPFSKNKSPFDGDKMKLHTGSMDGAKTNKIRNIFGIALSLIFVFLGYWLYSTKQINIPGYVRILCLVASFVLGGLTFLFISTTGKKFGTYIKDSTSELKKVAWPQRKDTIKMTVYVMIFVCILAIFIFIIDNIITWLLYDLFLLRG